MFRTYKYPFTIVSFLSLVFLTTSVIISTTFFTQSDAVVGATFKRYFDSENVNNYNFIFVNYLDTKISYDLEPATDKKLSGSVPARERVSVETSSTVGDSTFEKGNVSVIKIPDKPDPKFRFWSGWREGQYINLLEGDGYKETKNTSEISEISGNNLRITVDGGGVNNPSTRHIYIQVYKG